MAKTTNYRKIRTHYNKALRVLDYALAGIQAAIEAAEASRDRDFLTEYLEDFDYFNASLQLMKHHLFMEREKNKD